MYSLYFVNALFYSFYNKVVGYSPGKNNFILVALGSFTNYVARNRGFTHFTNKPYILKLVMKGRAGRGVKITKKCHVICE